MSTFRKTSLLITAFAFIFSHCLGQNEGTLTTDVMFPDVYPQIELQKVYADSYSEASLIKNVVLPGELGGAIPTDIIYLEGYNKFYVYGKRRLIVIDAITNTVTKSIEISSNSQYEPVERNGANQAWHESHLVLAGNFVYCATEEFKILRINPVDDAIETVVETPTNLSLDNYYNNMIIKYDARTNRIYWVISQFDGEYSTVLIYNASNFQLIQQLDLDHIDTYGTIEDIEINETLDEFYVGCSKGIRRYNANNFQLLEVIDENGEQKGDLLYINENGVHCLYCFPRTWGEEDAHIFKIDFTTNTTSSFISPLPTETACFYNENTNEIYVGFYPSGNNENNVFVINPMDNSIETGIATQMNSDPYWNFPIDFASYNNKVILCQRNEIVLIDEDNFSVEMVGNSLAENNMYYKCAVSANHALVTSPGGGNVQVINASNSIEETLEVGASLYFGCFNPAKNKAYFYTYFSPTGLIGKSKVYIYNTLTDEITIVEMGNNISDMFVYAPNEETNRVYVSTFEDTWIIKSIDGETDAITESGNGNWIYLDPDQGYCSSMFLAPNNKLYCMAGLDNEGSHEAGIEIFDANNDFELIELNKLSDMHGRLGGEFCYNSFNNKVYAVAKDMFPYSVYGKLVEIDGETDVVTFESNIGNNPWHIVCSPIKNKVYVQHGTSTTNLTVFDCNISSITSVSVGYPVWDIEYDPVRDLVFALYAESDTHKLGIVDDLSFFPGMKLPLSSCAIAYNPGNSSIYSYVAHNNANDEEAEMWECKLDYYDGVSVGFSSTQIPLGGKHTYKFDGHLANNDILFDENLNQIYVANGGHSNISVIGFDQQEPLVLHKGYNWISVPRHLRTNGNTTPTPTVFSQEKVSPGYDFINIDYNNISIEDGAGTLRPEFAQWDNVYHEWHYQSGEASVMKDIVSTRGYVMNAEPDGNRVLLLEGTVEDPATEIELYCKKENWIGYFLPEEQNVFDALANIEEDIYHIKHEDYACWRYDYNISNVCTDGFKSGNALSPGTWVCNGQPVIKYGEMIKVSPLHNIPDFKWNNSGKPSSGEIRPKVEYYVYEKLADYATFVIELDTTETKPTEIAAFVNNSCVGACSVLPTDTVVVLSAYLGEQPGDSVVFEQHYGTTKQSNRAITNYLVKDNQRQVFERKAIRTGEKQEAYIISFNPEKLTNPIAGTTAELTLYPNPASHSVLLNVMLERKGFASMEVYDMQGRQVKVLISQELPAGNSMFNWDLTNQQGIRLQTGAYVVKLTTDQHSTTRKLLVE